MVVFQSILGFPIYSAWVLIHHFPLWNLQAKYLIPHLSMGILIVPLLDMVDISQRDDVGKALSGTKTQSWVQCQLQTKTKIAVFSQ